MAVPREPKPVKFFVALLYGNASVLPPLEDDLTRHFGCMDLATEPLPWTVTNYYEKEMGSGLWRRFVSFESLVSPETLAEAKLSAGKLEEKYRLPKEQKAARTVNIDPGYVEADKMVLASTKNAAHRVYLRSGIYAEATLQFANGLFQSFDHTYPDYRWSETRSFFTRVRDLYLKQLKESR